MQPSSTLCVRRCRANKQTNNAVNRTNIMKTNISIRNAIIALALTIICTFAAFTGTAKGETTTNAPAGTNTSITITVGHRGFGTNILLTVKNQGEGVGICRIHLFPNRKGWQRGDDPRPNPILESGRSV